MNGFNEHCECAQAGFCVRHGVEKNAREFQLCAGINCTVFQCSRHFEAWELGRKFGQTGQPVPHPQKVETRPSPAADLLPIVKTASKGGCGGGCGGKGKSLISRGLTLAKATLKHVADGGAPTPADALSFRESQCGSCFFNNVEADQCRDCGCQLHENSLNKGKLQWRSEACSAGKWSRHTDKYRPLVNPTRNLIFHLYPKRGAEFNWHWHIEQIRRHAHLFNGKIAIGIVHGPDTASPEGVQLLMRDIPVTDWVITPNVTDLSETATFLALLNLVKTDEPNTITLRAHTKGVTHPSGTLWQEWAELLWATALDIPSVEDALASHVMAGSMKCHKGLINSHKYPWYYAGSVYWFRSEVFKRLWNVVENKRWFVEAWPGGVARVDEAACLCHDRTQGPALRDPYWQTKVVPDWNRWKAARPHYKSLPMAHATRTIPDKAVTEGVTLITPTGDRPEAFALCEKWMSRQTFKGPLQWIVVDDGVVATKVTMGQQYRRESNQKYHTLPRNLRTALPLVKHDKVLIIEDDEWYAPNYVEQMATWMNDNSLVGTGIARYYWPRLGRYRDFPHHTHASLCRTGFRANLIPQVMHCCQSDDPSIDMRLWKMVPGKRHDVAAPLVVGMKGMPGRKSGGGDPMAGNADHGLTVLKSWIGDDIEQYRPILPKFADATLPEKQKIVVYTVVLGGYDTIRTPLVVNPKIRYVAITDGPAPAPWEVMRPPETKYSLKHASRQWKLLAHELFSDADWTIYYDGQLQMACDPLALLTECQAWGDADFYAFRHHDRDCIFAEFGAVARVRRDTKANMASQETRYRRMGFPAHSGVYLGGMLIRRGGMCDALNKVWWHEVSTGSHRDQISLPVAIASSGVRFQPLPALWWQHFFVRHPHTASRPAANPRRKRGALRR